MALTTLLIIIALMIFIKKFTHVYKIIFLVYITIFTILFFNAHNANNIGHNDMYLVKTFMFGIVLFVFLTILSFVKDKKNKKKILSFALEYGLLYFFMVLLLKIIFYLFSNANYSVIDTVVTILPYKWVLFIIIAIIYNKYIRYKIKGILRNIRYKLWNILDFCTKISKGYNKFEEEE